MSVPIVAVVTGASSGLDEATARLLATEHGAAVVLVARRRERLATLAQELPGATYVAVDVLRLTETLLPLLRASAPSAIVNVSSTAARVPRAGSAAYSASKAALAAWSDGLHLEEAPHGVHVGTVLPGFIATEGFPQAELTGNTMTRWLVSTPERGV